MMQRKDLAKEFSLLVQQEIKNHNDMILTSNSAMDEFRRKIQEISDNTEKKLALLASFYTDNHEEMRRTEQESKTALFKLACSLNDLTAQMESHFKDLSKSQDKRESYFLTIDGFKEFQQKVDQWIAHIKVSFSSQKDCIVQETKKISETFDKKLIDHKEEVSKQFLALHAEQKELNSALNIFAANLSGFIREIEFCKKRCFVIEKNIENIYTQIERLKGKI